MPDRNTLRRAVAAAQTGAELAEAVAALDAHDQGLRATAAQNRELDLAGQHVARALSPVPLFEHHTAATDWLGTEDEPGGDYKTAMISEASVWYRNLDPAVRADRDEFGAQLAGRVQTVASAWGAYAPAARSEFLSVVGYLHRTTAASGLPQIDQTVDPNNAPSASPYPTEVFDNFAPPENDYNGGIEGENHDSQISSQQAPMLQQIEQQNGGGSGFGSGPEKPVTHDTAFDPGLGYAEVPLGAPGTIPTAPGAAPQAASTPNPNEGVDDYDESSHGKQASYTAPDPHGYRWVTGSREIMHPFHAGCGSSHWPGEFCGHQAHTASVAIGYTGSLDDFRRTAQLELLGAEHGRKAVAAAQGPRQLAERYNQVMAGYDASAQAGDDVAVLHGFMAVVRPVLAEGSRGRLDFPLAAEAASSLPTEHQVIDPNNAPTQQADQFSTDVMFPIDPAFAAEWETGPQGAQPKSGQAKEAASMTPSPGAARMFGRMDAMEGKHPHHKDRYPFSKIQHGHYLRGWNETAGLTHGMSGRPPMTPAEYSRITGRPDLHQHYLSHYALGSGLDNGPDTHGAAGESVVSALDAGLQSLAGDSGAGVSMENDHCPSCGHRPGCNCPEDCDELRREENHHHGMRRQADTLSMPHQTTDDINPPFNSAETTPDVPGSDGDAGYKAGISDANAGERPAFADSSPAVSPYVKRYAEGYSSVHLPPPGQPDVPGSMGGDSGQAANAQEAATAFQVAKASKTAGTSVDLVSDGPGTSPDPMGSTPINGPGTPPPSGGRGDPARSGGAPPYQGTAPLPGGPVVSDDVMGKAQEPEQPDGPLPQGFSGPGSGYGNQQLAPRGDQDLAPAAPNTAAGPGYENDGAYDGDPRREQRAAAFRATVQANLAGRHSAR
jgi:hypothetical protein